MSQMALKDVAAQIGRLETTISGSPAFRLSR